MVVSTQGFQLTPDIAGSINAGLNIGRNFQALLQDRQRTALGDQAVAAGEADAVRQERLRELQGIILTGGAAPTAAPSSGQQAQLAGRPNPQGSAQVSQPTPPQRVEQARQALQTEFPEESIELQKQIDEASRRQFESADEQTQIALKNFTQSAGQIVGSSVDDQVEFLERRIRVGAEQGVDMSDSANILEALRTDPEQAQQMIKDAARFGEALGFIDAGTVDDQFEDVLDSQGNVIAQRNLRTNRIEDSPLAPGGERQSAKQKAEAGLRKEFTGLSKVFRDQRSAFERVKNSAARETAAGDLALIFAFMKTQDPESVVRESEFATAEGAQAAIGRAEESGEAVPNFVRRGIAKLLDGTRLLPDQRKDFVDTARGIFDGAVAEQKAIEQQYRELADRSNLDASNVVLDFRGGAKPRLEDLTAADLENLSLEDLEELERAALNGDS